MRHGTPARMFLALLATAIASVGTLSAQPAPRALQRGTAIAATLASGDTARFTIDADAKTFVWGVVDQRSVDVVVRVLAPDGTPLARVDGPDRGDERFRFETRAAGAHQVQVLGFEGATGDFTIRVERMEPVASDPRRLADQLFSGYGPTTPGGEVAVFRDGKTIFAKAYGMANLAYGVPFRLDTRTNIGSTSKQFTAFAVMLLVEDGKVDLDADVRTYIPELPDLGAKVTVRHLLTHTSGYREFLNHVILGGRRLDHGDYLDRKELIGIVQRQGKLQNVPGAEFNYNNTAFGLAAMIVERVSGMDFPDFMAQRVFQPIGMTSTVVRRDPETIVPGMSMGYRPGGKAGYLETRDLFGAMGAGGIYTTVADLQRWVENLDAPKVGSRAIVQQMTTSFVLANGDSTGYGFGLFIDTHRGLKRIQHGGADAAHRSALFYYPGIHAGITTQSNDAAFDGSIAARLAEAFFAAEMSPASAAPVAFDAARYDPRRFDDFVGRYALDAAPAFVLTFSRSGDTLWAQATGQGRNRIFPTSDSTFELRVVAASLTFHRAADRTVTGLTLHQGGDQRATRLKGEAPPRWAPTPAELAQFAGRYLSDELEAVYTLELRGDTLVARHIRTDDATLRSSGQADTFNGANAVWTFERDRNGRVIGFYLANGRTRNVRFARLP